jgi:thiamine-monophosphate kinase
LKAPSFGSGSEFDLIRRLVGSPGSLNEGVLLGSGDDCAVLESGVVISSDLSVEDIHFRREWITLQEAGYRAAAGALSDLAAMAAEPLGILLSMALAPEEAEVAAQAFQAGAREACAREGIQILGGDLSRSPGPAVLDVVVLGRSEAPLLRSGSLPGDELWVTGWLGGSSAAVHQWTHGVDPSPTLREAFSRPHPRIREIRWLVERAEIHGCIDLSDGLAGDTGHLAAASGVAVALDAVSLPLHPGLVQEGFELPASLHFALRGGEDYEVCFSASPGTLDEHVPLFREEFGIPLSRVGQVQEGAGVLLLETDGARIPLAGGFSHFHEEEGE